MNGMRISRPYNGRSLVLLQGRFLTALPLAGLRSVRLDLPLSLLDLPNTKKAEAYSLLPQVPKVQFGSSVGS